MSGAKDRSVFSFGSLRRRMKCAADRTMNLVMKHIYRQNKSVLEWESIYFFRRLVYFEVTERIVG